MAKTFRVLECIKPTQGFTVGKSYKLLGQHGKYVEIEDDTGERQIMLDIYFSEIIKKKK
jgi:hypothetical protein